MVPEAATQPDKTEIRRDLEFMTSWWHELSEPAVFEVRAFAEGKQPQNMKFAPDWIDDAVDAIASLNARGRNVYVVRNPIRDPGSRSATDADIIAAKFLWADCDDGTAADNVRRFDGPKYSAAVVTGRTPETRVHIYWQLEQPCTDMAAWRDMQTRIAAHFDSDKSVINPSRIMRIAGTVTWPDSKKQAKGYISEVTTLRTEYPDPRPPVSLDQMGRVFGKSGDIQHAAKSGTLAIDTGPQPLDRERARIQALSGQEWHNAVIRLVGSYVAKGLSDDEIHGLTAPLTLDGYTVDDTRREVQTAIDGARRKGWTPEVYAAPPAPDEDWGSDPAAPSPQFEWFDDVEAALADNYIIKGVLAQESMSVVYGPSNSGKTFLALDIAFAVATGTPWQRRRVRAASVLYLAAEGGRGVANRIAALKAVTGCVEVPFALRRAGMDLLHAQADLQAVYDLAQTVKAQRPDMPLLIVIDTLSRVMAGGDENSAADMTALIRNIDAIRQATSAHVMLVHHTGKDTARGARGHSSLRAATDTEIEVQNEDGTRAAMVTKQRDYQGGETFAFTLKSVTLGHDQDGDEVTSCVVESADADDFLTAKKQKSGLGGVQKIIADTFDMMLADGVARPNPGGPDMPEPGRFWVVDFDDLKDRARGKITAKDDLSSFRKAMAALTADRGLFVMAGKMVWRLDRRVN